MLSGHSWSYLLGSHSGISCPNLEFVACSVPGVWPGIIIVGQVIAGAKRLAWLQHHVVALQVFSGPIWFITDIGAVWAPPQPVVSS